MVSEQTLERVLDLITKAPESEIESLHAYAIDHAKSMRQIVGTKNVIAVGISEKITKKKPTGKLALTFYVERKVPPKKLRAHLAIPPTVAEALSGPEAIPTDVIVLGSKIRPEANIIRNPVQPGNSIGHVDISAGTLGAIVTKGNTLFILSNSHVLAVSGTAKKGDPIVYPGKYDGGEMPDDLVAKLSDFKEFVLGGDYVNRVDCAIAEPTAACLYKLTSEIKGLGVPKGTIKPKRGMKVVKVGRTTGKTTGEIRDLHLRFKAPYDKVGEVGFIDQVLCTRYTKPGDSGSLVLDQATGRAVGLHLGAAKLGSVFSPIDEVLNALGVKLITKCIGEPQTKPAKKVTKKSSKETTAKKSPSKRPDGQSPPKKKG